MPRTQLNSAALALNTQATHVQAQPMQNLAPAYVPAPMPTVLTVTTAVTTRTFSRMNTARPPRTQ